MKWEPRPVPDVTPETEPFWTGASDGEFRLCSCTNCGLTYYYPRRLCPDCFSDDIEWRAASGTGEVYTYSVASSVNGWPESDLPLIVAYVELDEGPRVLTNVCADPESISIGTRVEVTFAETDYDDIAIPVFEPVEE